MPQPLGICLEDLNATTASSRFLRCVAVVGRKPGLRLAADATVLWQSDGESACELWVSADDRLILFRPEGAAPVRVHRAGRSLDAPYGKPVVLITRDTIEVGGRHIRVHIHGAARAVVAPSPLPEPSRPSKARVAAVVAMGAAVAGCGGGQSETQQPPSTVVAVPPEPAPSETATGPLETEPPPAGITGGPRRAAAPDRRP